jgi:hypothetical protein
VTCAGTEWIALEGDAPTTSAGVVLTVFVVNDRITPAGATSVTSEVDALMSHARADLFAF